MTEKQKLKILKAEMRGAINYMKNNKTTGPDEIVVKPIKDLEEFDIEKLTFTSSGIHDGGEVSKINIYHNSTEI